MTSKDFDEFMDKLFECDKEIYKKQKKESERRKKNYKLWDKAERELTKLQGEERSPAYNVIKTFSVSFSPIGSTFYNKLRSELTENEKRVLYGDN